MRFFAKVFLTCAPLVVACSTNFSARECKVDGDCGAGMVCASPGQGGNATGSQSACVEADLAPLRIGMSAPTSGPNQQLGIQMRDGILLAFTEQNNAGGVGGRPLDLDLKDDSYDPVAAEATAHTLLDVQEGSGRPRCPSTHDSPPTAPGVSSTELDRGPNSVLAILGNVGTPTMVRFAPIAVETQTLFFGAFTGATLMLRDDTAGACKRFIFNVRASYAQEARATLEYFIRRAKTLSAPLDYRHLISFDQNDTYGEAGYAGLKAAYKDLQATTAPSLATLPDGDTPFARYRYQREDPGGTSAAQATNTIDYITDQILVNPGPQIVGILMTDTYGAGENYIKAVQDWRAGLPPETASRLAVIFSNVSFVGANSLADRLKDATDRYTKEVYVSQVVPNYADDDSDIVKVYKGLVPDANARNFTSFEGYISARIFIAGLVAEKRAYTSENLISTFENLHDLPVGLGASSGFSANDHNYSKTVWGTAIQPDGTFKSVYFWSPGPGLQLYN